MTYTTTMNNDDAVPSNTGKEEENSMFLNNVHIKLSKECSFSDANCSSAVKSDIVEGTLERSEFDCKDHSYSRSKMGICSKIVSKKSQTELPVKRKSSSNHGGSPFKVYKTIQNSVEVEFQPEMVLPTEKIGESLSKSDKSTSFSIKKGSFDKNSALKNVGLVFKSTIEFETDDEASSSDSVGVCEPNASSSSWTGNLFSPQSKSTSLCLSTELKELKHKNSESNIVSPTEILFKGLQENLKKVNKTLKSQLPCYGNKPRNKKSNFSHLDFNDPRYSIASTADSLGTFNSFVKEPIQEVNLFDGEWSNLYEPSLIKFPKLSEPQIGLMVNQLRGKVSFLNDRDKLEVLFLLSMMSTYPNAPKHIKELLSQRLNLVYIATMFKWETAISLGSNFYDSKEVNSVKSLPRRNTALTDGKLFNNSNGTSSFHSIHSLDDCSNLKNNNNSKEKVSKLAKQTGIAFEILIKKKCDETKVLEGEKS